MQGVDCLTMMTMDDNKDECGDERDNDDGTAVDDDGVKTSTWESCHANPHEYTMTGIILTVR